MNLSELLEHVQEARKVAGSHGVVMTHGFITFMTNCWEEGLNPPESVDLWVRSGNYQRSLEQRDAPAGLVA